MLDAVLLLSAESVEEGAGQADFGAFSTFTRPQAAYSFLLPLTDWDHHRAQAARIVHSAQRTSEDGAAGG